MAGSSVQTQANAQRLRNYGLGAAFIVVFYLLHLGAQEARKHVGDEVASKTGKDEFGHCLNFPVGSLSCIAKQGIKTYTNNFRATFVAHAKQSAYDAALDSAKSDGLEISEAVRKAQKISDTAAKAQKQQLQRIIGPLFAAVWDGVEVVYYGGSLAEVTLRATGTLCGTWWGGVVGQERLGRGGYLIGSMAGSWAGSKVALMIHDIAIGIQAIIFEVKDFVTGSDENEKVGGDTGSEENIAENTYQSPSGESAYENPSSEESGSGWFSGSEDEKSRSDEL